MTSLLKRDYLNENGIYTRGLGLLICLNRHCLGDGDDS